ncbi:MAG: hypothetical protein JSU70_05750, partial [Phycisphaerales bacterium]
RRHDKTVPFDRCQHFLYLQNKLFVSGTLFLLTHNIRLFSHAGLGHFLPASNQGKEGDFVSTAILYRTKKTLPIICSAT